MTKNQCHGRFVESFGRLHLAQSLHDAGYVCAEPIIDNGVAGDRRSTGAWAVISYSTPEASWSWICRIRSRACSTSCHYSQQFENMPAGQTLLDLATRALRSLFAIGSES
jgi:hypothetical protein